MGGALEVLYIVSRRRGELAVCRGEKFGTNWSGWISFGWDGCFGSELARGRRREEKGEEDRT